MRAVWRAFSPLVVSAVVAIAAWAAFLKIFDINALIGKSPAAVWEFLVTTRRRPGTGPRSSTRC